MEWIAQTKRECNFFFGNIITNTNGSLYYAHGSMAPMLVNDCIAARALLRIHEIKLAYVQGEPY